MVSKHELVELELKDFYEFKWYLLGRKSKEVDVSHVTKMLAAYHDEKHGMSLTYYHHMMCAAIVHPDIKIVLPFAPEPVLKNEKRL